MEKSEKSRPLVQYPLKTGTTAGVLLYYCLGSLSLTRAKINVADKEGLLNLLTTLLANERTSCSEWRCSIRPESQGESLGQCFICNCLCIGLTDSVLSSGPKAYTGEIQTRKLLRHLELSFSRYAYAAEDQCLSPSTTAGTERALRTQAGPVAQKGRVTQLPQHTVVVKAVRSGSTVGC